MIKEKYLGAYMKTARVFAELSNAKRKRVGAVIVKDNRIISIGYNGMPSGWDNNCEDEIHEESEYVIGVYSTAMFEAVALGCKVGVLKLAGYNHIEPLIHSGAIQEINRVADIEKFFVTAKQNRNSASYFAKQVPARILLDGALARIEDQ